MEATTSDQADNQIQGVQTQGSAARAFIRREGIHPPRGRSVVARMSSADSQPKAQPLQQGMWQQILIAVLSLGFFLVLQIGHPELVFGCVQAGQGFVVYVSPPLGSPRALK